MAADGFRVDGLTDVRRTLAALTGELAEASRLAQNKMAYQVRVAEREQMAADLDRPTPWSLNALRYSKAKIGSGGRVSGASVYMANAFTAGTNVGPDEWLGVQILGGQTAGPKRSERRLQSLSWMPRDHVWVPAAETPLDRYGNVRGSMISDMLSNLGANPYGRNADPSAVDVRYVLVGPMGKEEGVFRKVRGQWVPFLWFVPRQRYTQRFEFYQRAMDETRADFQRHIDHYVTIGLARAGRR